MTTMSSGTSAVVVRPDAQTAGAEVVWPPDHRFLRVAFILVSENRQARIAERRNHLDL